MGPGGATSTAAWTGVALSDVLGLAGPSEGAAHVGFVGADVCAGAAPAQPFGGSIPLDKACRPEVLLAWGMNGEPLPPVHRGPLRVVVPGYIGARSVKWLERIEVRSMPWDSPAVTQPEDEAALWNPKGLREQCPPTHPRRVRLAFGPRHCVCARPVVSPRASCVAGLVG